MLEQISTSLFDQSTELHFTLGAINNLEKVLKAQEAQQLSDLVQHTNKVLRLLKARAKVLEASVAKLTKEQTEAYKAMVS